MNTKIAESCPTDLSEVRNLLRTALASYETDQIKDVNERLVAYEILYPIVSLPDVSFEDFGRTLSCFQILADEATVKSLHSDYVSERYQEKYTLAQVAEKLL